MRPENRRTPQNYPQNQKQELPPFYTKKGTRQRATTLNIFVDTRFQEIVHAISGNGAYFFENRSQLQN
jgi:hypothetical protein